MITGPTSVVGSSGSPSTSASARATRRSTTAVATPFCRISREVEVHRWPEVPKAPNRAPSSTRSRSASSSTTMAFLPPSSRLTSFGPTSMAAAATLRPVGTDPVKDTAPTPGWVARAAAGSGPPWTTWTRSAGMPASMHASTNATPQAGRQLGRLHHDAVAGEQRWEDLPARDGHREVPRRDHPDHPDRDAGGPGQLVVHLRGHHVAHGGPQQDQPEPSNRAKKKKTKKKKKKPIACPAIALICRVHVSMRRSRGWETVSAKAVS